MFQRPARFRAALIAFALSASTISADTLHVDASLTTGANDGTTWADAFQGPDGLQAALAVAQATDRVFVREGNYRPSSSGNRNDSFLMLNDVEIYGSFVGTETEPEQRPPFGSAPSVLDGDLAGDDGSGQFGDNSFHVVRTSGTNATALLDGFHVINGAATGGGSNQDRGGGILCIGNVSPVIQNCRFIANRCTFGGAAGYINGSSPSFVDCSFEDGDGGSFGGAFDVATSTTVLFERCSFLNNTAARGGGLEIFNTFGAVVNNCTFQGNVATGNNSGGAGLWIGQGGNTQVRSCTVVDNESTNQANAGIRVQSAGGVTIVGCIIYDNIGPGGTQSPTNQVNLAANVTYSIVEGGNAGTGNIDADPGFVDGASGDLRLAPGSAAIDAGDNSAVPVGTLTDFGGGARFVDDPATVDTGNGTAPLVDMGAHEFGSGLSAEIVRLGTPPNPNAFLPGQTTAPTVGGVWDPVLDHSSFLPGSIADFALVTGSPFELVIGAEGTLLCNVADPLFVFVTAPAPGVPFALPIPNNLPLVGIEICAQGGSVDAGLAGHLANALDVTIGG